MSHIPFIKTQRLILRPWKLEDFEPFAKLNTDPHVREYFPSVLTGEESNQLAMRLKTKFEEKGWGFWAAILSDSQEFIGFIGLNDFDASYITCSICTSCRDWMAIRL